MSTIDNQLRVALWLYFWLLFTDGILRKWLLPGLSTQLLLVRDPIAIFCMLRGWAYLWHSSSRIWIQSIYLIGVSSFLLALTVGHGDFITAAYGVRIFLFHLPLIFLFPCVFDRDDVFIFCRVVVSLVIPMTILIVIQSSLPATHILNIAPGGEGTAVFAGALDRFRPPGVFSFINGLALFYGFAFASLMALLFGMSSRRFNNILRLVPIGVSLVIAIPVSMSRSLLFAYALVFIALVISFVISATPITSLVRSFSLIALVVIVGISVPTFKSSVSAFSSRWHDAAEVESSGNGVVGVLNSRVFTSLLKPLSQSHTAPLLGYGIGMGTNVGSQRLTGKFQYLIAEDSWEATLGEHGLFLGFFLLTWRLLLMLRILTISFSQALAGNIVPFVLSGVSLFPVLDAQLGQTTALGFLVITAGLTLASSVVTPAI